MGRTLHLKPNKKQREALRHLIQSQTKFIAYGGAAGGGKTWLGWEWLLVMCITHKGSRWFVGRDELKKLRTTTLTTFFKVIKHYDIGPENYKYNGQDHFLEIFGSRVDLLELKYYPSDPLFERFGSFEFTGGWIEEAGEVHSGAFDILKARIGRHLNRELNLPAKMLITCNPKRNWIYNDFYKPYKEDRLGNDKVFIPALISDNPYLDKAYIENLKSITNKAQKERLLHGNFEYEDDPANIFEYDSLQDMIHKGEQLELQWKREAKQREQENWEPKATHISNDVARLGDDRTVILIWAGLHILDAGVYRKQGVDKTIEDVSQFGQDYNIPPSKIVIDEDGVGGGVKDGIRGSKGFVNNARPLKYKGKEENYTNQKSQCYFHLARAVAEGKVTLSSKVASMLIDGKTIGELLTEELSVIKRKDVDKDGKVSVEGKDKTKELLGRSPDLADAVMMRMFYELKGEMKLISI